LCVITNQNILTYSTSISHYDHDNCDDKNDGDKHELNSTFSRF